MFARHSFLFGSFAKPREANFTPYLRYHERLQTFGRKSATTAKIATTANAGEAEAT